VAPLLYLALTECAAGSASRANAFPHMSRHTPASLAGPITKTGSAESLEERHPWGYRARHGGCGIAPLLTEHSQLVELAALSVVERKASPSATITRWARVVCRGPARDE